MTPIYHITHIANLPGILAHGGLLADAQVSSAGLAPIYIAHGHIKQRRAQTRVAPAPGGTLADYVPFDLCPRSPMLHTLHRGHVTGYPGGQAPIAHLVCDAETIEASAIACPHTDGNAASLPVQTDAGISGFDTLTWDIIRNWKWHDTPDDNDRKRRDARRAADA